MNEYETQSWCLVGMKAVCSGPAEGCHFTNADNCVVTPLSSICNQPMWELNLIWIFEKKDNWDS